MIDKNLLRAKLAGALRRCVPDADVFSETPGVAMEPWNGVNGERPLARIECRDAAGVTSALRVARDHGVPVSVAGGRLDPFGRNNRDGHLVIDLRRMVGIVHDVERATVTAQGGVTTAALLNHLPAEIVTATTANGDVGLVGAATGGGYSMLSGRLGLICDGLRSAEVVLADGSCVVASELEHAELFWGLRGGGSGFGVVTAATFATFELPSVLTGAIHVPFQSFAKVLSTMQTALDEHPDDLGLIPFIMKGRDGRPDMTLVFAWHGRERDGEPVRARFTALPGTELMAGGPVPYRDTLDHTGLWPWGKHWDGDTRSVSRMDGPITDCLIEAASEMPPGAVLFSHDFHGAGTRVPADDTAFPLRKDHHVIAMVGGWDPGDDAADAQRAWIDRTSEKLARRALPGGYVNFLRPDRSARVRLFYGRHAERLLALKRRLDPLDLFDAGTGRFSE